MGKKNDKDKGIFERSNKWLLFGGLMLAYVVGCFLFFTHTPLTHQVVLGPGESTFWCQNSPDKNQIQMCDPVTKTCEPSQSVNCDTFLFPNLIYVLVACIVAAELLFWSLPTDGMFKTDSTGESWAMTAFFKAAGTAVAIVIVFFTNVLTPLVFLVPVWIWLNTLKWNK